MQRGDVPFITPAVTFGFTMRVFEAVNVLLPQSRTVYVMMVVPALTAVTTPELEFTVATVVLLLLQLPPDVPELVYVAD